MDIPNGIIPVGTMVHWPSESLRYGDCRMAGLVKRNHNGVMDVAVVGITTGNVWEICERRVEEYKHYKSLYIIEHWDKEKENKTMKFNDLKAGMRVELRNGSFGILVPTKEGFSMILGDGTYSCIDKTCYNDDMECILSETKLNNKPFDIVKVYDLYAHNGDLMSLLYCPDTVKPLWERKDKVEMTMKELEEKLGFPVKIVKEHE